MNRTPGSYPKSKGIINEAITGLGQETCQMINMIRSPTMRPYASARVNGEIIPCLFDTGADVSCVNAKTLKNVQTKGKIATLGGQKPLKSAGGQSLKVKGIQRIQLEIDGNKWNTRS